jgi:hypothetical protein
MNLRLNNNIHKGFGFGSGRHHSLRNGQSILRGIGTETLIEARHTGTSGT